MKATIEASPVAPFDPSSEERALDARCAAALEAARRLGADEAEAYATRSRTISVRFEKGDLKLAQVDDGAGLGVRVFRGRRMGFASTNRGEPAAIEAAVRDALSLAVFSPAHEANVLPSARPIEARPSLFSSRIAEFSIERAVEAGAKLLERAKARDPRLSIDGASCDVTCVAQALQATTGARGTESDAQVSLSIAGMGIDGSDVGGMHYDGDSLRAIDDLDASLERLVDLFARGAIENLGAGAAESYRGPLLLAPAAFLSLCISPLVSASSAVAVQRGRSALAGKLGTEIASPLLAVHDDPTDRGLSGACAFDREGQPARRFALVERGVLQSWLYNGYAAAVDRVQSTGHASGGARSVPGLGPHALVVATGSGGDEAALCKALGRGLYVGRFSGTIDPASGDFSGVAKSARWVEGGVVVRSVKETLVSGNAFDVLRSLRALSSTSERCWASARVPWALVDGISVTAG